MSLIYKNREYPLKTEKSLTNLTFNISAQNDFVSSGNLYYFQNVHFKPSQKLTTPFTYKSPAILFNSNYNFVDTTTKIVTVITDHHFIAPLAIHRSLVLRVNSWNNGSRQQTKCHLPKAARECNENNESW